MSKSVEKINLQPAHIRAYRFVEKYVSKNIVAPEMEEIAKAIKLTLRHTYRIIDDLRTLGYLTKEAHKRRSIKIVRPLK